MSRLDGVTPDDEHALTVARTLGGPRPPQNSLVRLIASAQGVVTDTDFAFPDRDRNERLKLVRLKSRRARELREAFA